MSATPVTVAGGGGMQAGDEGSAVVGGVVYAKEDVGVTTFRCQLLTE